jgi:hypothetical protein
MVPFSRACFVEPKSPDPDQEHCQDDVKKEYDAKHQWTVIDFGTPILPSRRAYPEKILFRESARDLAAASL